MHGQWSMHITEIPFKLNRHKGGNFYKKDIL